jgi:hypothetical protein
MTYKEYIDLDFDRIEMSDVVEFKETGYYGFCLKKKLSKKVSIEVCSGELDKPKLYIKKSRGDTYHIILINGEIVKDLLSKTDDNKPFPY